jgi:sterol desaturase/sphingolipid hydroxylase (fatty acid hydroxylase superfamily)
LLVIRSFSAYWLHRACHRVPWLWRWHRVHHSDAAVDVSTGFRNHPVEALFAIALASAVVFALAPSVSAVIAVDTILLITAFWQHTDIALPRGLSRAVEWVVVTPDFHRIHHSPDRADFDTNYGDITTIWDRLFGSLRSPEPSRGGERAIV